MKTPIAAAAVAAALYLLAGATFAAEPCDVPGYLLFGSNELKHVAEAVQKQHKLTIAVVGTGSSILAGPDGPRSAYPARLEAVLKQKLPGIDVKVVSLVRTRMTTEDLAKGMEKMLANGYAGRHPPGRPRGVQGGPRRRGRDAAQRRRGRHLDEHAIQPPDRHHGCARSVRR